MEDTDWTAATAIAPEQLPAHITAYLAAHRARDLDAALAHYTDDAVAIDEGHTYRGPEQIRGWLATAAREYTFTSTLTSAARLGGNRYDALYHLEGDFPGGTADLHFRFTLDATRIARLVIEP